jgi:hypothetical protein
MYQQFESFLIYILAKVLKLVSTLQHLCNLRLLDEPNIALYSN